VTAGNMKIDVRNIVRAHRATYLDASTERRRWRDFILMEGVPTVLFVLCLVLNVRVRSPLATGLLTVTGLLSALFFGVMLQMSDRAMSWADSMPQRGAETSEHAIFLMELAANAGYAALVSIMAAIAYGVVGVSSGWILRVSSAVALALGVHLVFVLFMVMKRVFALTENRLNRARTTPVRPQKRVS
jgi:hypothetical protein